MGAIEGQWLEEQQKLDILVMIEEAKEKGIALTRSCALLRVNRRRVARWRKRRKDHESLSNLKAGSKEPLHTLLPGERTAVVEMASREEYADLGHRILTVTAWDLEVVFLSFSSVYRILRAANLISMRGSQRHHHGGSLPPVIGDALSERA